jgi:hypothetical protein
MLFSRDAGAMSYSNPQRNQGVLENVFSERYQEAIDTPGANPTAISHWANSAFSSILLGTLLRRLTAYQKPETGINRLEDTPHHY